MNNERSAEFYRGAIWQWGEGAKLDELDDLLAAAEAREAKERGAWILSQNTEPKPHDWFHSGLSAHPSCRVCGIIQRRDGKNSPCKGPVSIGLREASVPTAADAAALITGMYYSEGGGYDPDDTREAIAKAYEMGRSAGCSSAAEVIAECRKAFHRIYWDHEEAEDMEREAKEQLAAIAKYKEAKRGN